jgi:hypothetical protein
MSDWLGSGELFSLELYGEKLTKFTIIHDQGAVQAYTVPGGHWYSTENML